MKVKELLELLSELDGDVEVYAESDHGQDPEMVGRIKTSCDHCEYSGEDMHWDVGIIEPKHLITSVCIGG